MLPFCELHNWQDNFRWDPLIRLETASHDSRLQASAAGTRQPYHEMKTSFCSLLWLLQKPHKTLLITRPLKRQRMFPKPGCVCVCCFPVRAGSILSFPCREDGSCIPFMQYTVVLSENHQIRIQPVSVVFVLLFCRHVPISPSEVRSQRYPMPYYVTLHCQKMCSAEAWMMPGSGWSSLFFWLLCRLPFGKIWFRL